MFPAIYGDYVVWEDYRNGRCNGGWDIYGYNLVTEEEFRITTDPEDQSDPAIYDNTVVWTDDRNDGSDIYGYNLVTEEEFQITTDLRNQLQPAIYENIVVWIDRSGRHDVHDPKDEICVYNLSTSEKYQLIIEGDPELPAIYGNIVVWGDPRNGNEDIYGYILPPSVLQTSEKPLEEEKREEDGGTCLGTVFIALLLLCLPVYLRIRR